MISGEDMYEERTAKLKGTTNDRWCWLQRDKGAWEGPLNDWNTSHYEKYVEPIEHKNVVVTAGGNMGLYTRAYSNIFKRVYVFEPDHFNFHALVRNNLAHNVFFFRAALGATNGWCSIDASNDIANCGMHKVTETHGGIIPVMTIDSLELPECNLIQLDVEGYESHIISGALNTIEKHSPDIVTEGNNSEITKLLGSKGYQLADSASKADFIYRRVKNV